MLTTLAICIIIGTIYLIKAKNTREQWFPCDHVIVPPWNHDRGVDHPMEAVHVYQSIHGRGQDVPLLIKSMEQQEIKEGTNNSKQVQAVPHLKGGQIVLIHRLGHKGQILKTKCIKN